MAVFRDPMQKIVERAIAFAEPMIVDTAGCAGLESPIELTLLAAMIAQIKFENGYSHPFDDLLIFRPSMRLDSYEKEHHPLRPYLRLQAPVLTYRADFLLSVVAGDKFEQPDPFKRLVIECDGHDFHERTKEQAAHDRARDRAMQAAGFTVFRFTGSEIHRDPCSCAAQVIRWAASVVYS